MTIILLSFAIALVVSILAYRAYLRASGPAYGGCVICDLPDYETYDPVIRNNHGQFAKGSKPLNVKHGPGGKFVSAKNA